MKLVWTTKQAARALLISTRRMNQLVKDGILSRAHPGRFDPSAIVPEFLKFKAATTEETTLLEQKIRWSRARASREEMELKVRTGELIETQQVERDAFRVARVVRDAMLSLPDRLAALVTAETDQAKNHTLMTKEIMAALKGLPL